MVVDLQKSAYEPTLIRHQRDPNDIDHSKQSKTKNAILSFKTYYIEIKWSNKAIENNIEYIEEEEKVSKEDTLIFNIGTINVDKIRTSLKW